MPATCGAREASDSPAAGTGIGKTTVANNGRVGAGRKFAVGAASAGKKSASDGEPRLITEWRRAHEKRLTDKRYRRGA